MDLVVEEIVQDVSQDSTILNIIKGSILTRIVTADAVERRLIINAAICDFLSNETVVANLRSLVEERIKSAGREPGSGTANPQPSSAETLLNNSCDLAESDGSRKDGELSSGLEQPSVVIVGGSISLDGDSLGEFGAEDVGQSLGLNAILLPGISSGEAGGQVPCRQDNSALLSSPSAHFYRGGVNSITGLSNGSNGIHALGTGHRTLVRSAVTPSIEEGIDRPAAEVMQEAADIMAEKQVTMIVDAGGIPRLVVADSWLLNEEISSVSPSKLRLQPISAPKSPVELAFPIKPHLQPLPPLRSSPNATSSPKIEQPPMNDSRPPAQSPSLRRLLSDEDKQNRQSWRDEVKEEPAECRYRRGDGAECSIQGPTSGDTVATSHATHQAIDKLATSTVVSISLSTGALVDDIPINANGGATIRSPAVVSGSNLNLYVVGGEDAVVASNNFSESESASEVDSDESLVIDSDSVNLSLSLEKADEKCDIEQVAAFTDGGCYVAANASLHASLLVSTTPPTSGLQPGCGIATLTSSPDVVSVLGLALVPVLLNNSEHSKSLAFDSAPAIAPTVYDEDEFEEEEEDDQGVSRSVPAIFSTVGEEKKKVEEEKGGGGRGGGEGGGGGEEDMDYFGGRKVGGGYFEEPKRGSQGIERSNVSNSSVGAGVGEEEKNDEGYSDGFEEVDDDDANCTLPVTAPVGNTSVLRSSTGNEEGAGFCRRRVRFAAELVSAVHERPRTAPADVRYLFYSCDELDAFQVDADREVRGQVLSGGWSGNSEQLKLGAISSDDVDSGGGRYDDDAPLEYFDGGGGDSDSQSDF